MKDLNDKLTLSTHDGAERNAALLTEWVAENFPNCISEGKVDFDALRQECSSEIVDGAKERYRLEWSGKREAIVTANRASKNTLRPIREDSKDFDTTENLYIEGDNLEVLKLLQESYLGQVKMIYIDPPYNTGNEFVYNDDFSKDERESLIEQGIIDEDGNVLCSDKNGTDKPRYHSDWLSFMYSRLKIARDLLSDDGAIFISIDDHEVHNLRKMCDEIYGEDNLIACVTWQRNYAPISLKKFFSESHEYCLVYSKNIGLFQMNLLPRTDKQNKDYKNPDNDPRGEWKVGNLTVGPAVEKQVYEIVGPTGKSFFPPSGYCWRFTKEKFEEMRKDNRIWFGIDGNNSPVPKLFLSEVQNGVTPMTLWTFEEAGHNQIATRELRDIFGCAVFTSPKPIKYITRFLTIGSNKDSIVLDFFSGSATTAHAVMQLNAEDGGNRKFIMVQLPEKTDEKSEAYKAGYKNICEIGKERIRRAGKKIMEEHPDAKIDTGFKVFRLDESNIKDVVRKPGDVTQGDFDFKENCNVVDNLREGRSAEDLLYQVMISWALPLTLPIVKTDMCGKTVYKVDGNSLYCCFEDGVDRTLAEAIARENPMRVLFVDNAFKDDTEKENVKQTLKQICPKAEMKVL